ncbi:MAG: M18 family aminopeptidase [Lachnospiraceae bacterium]|nr:M18 family aminopeptidase [Lachnospiraceae bacterium]
MQKTTKKNEHRVGARDRKIAETILSQISASPSAFHVIHGMEEKLQRAGFVRLAETDAWKLLPLGKKGTGRYYVTRNSSSLIAFVIPKRDFAGCRIAASHSDSPSFKLKEAPEKEDAGYIRLNVEGYGGMLCAPWFDRPLAIAGRLLVRKGRGAGSGIEQHLVQTDRDLLMLPSLAIHMNREANDGYKYNAQKDMLPVFGDAADTGRLMPILAEAAGVRAKDILGSDLFLAVREAPVFWGAGEQFMSSPRLDDQECAWCSLEGFLAAENAEQMMVHCVFDNEEVGSRTKQGAASTFLPDVLKRIGDSLGRSAEQYHRSIANSFMISADNAHAVHPAYPDKADPVHHPRMNGGIVLKYSASQKYTTDGVSAAFVRDLCEKNGIPVQTFVNRSDEAGGSTLGNIANAQVSMNTADIGLAQLAMHSPYESAGVEDVRHLIRFLQAFYCSGPFLTADV